MTELYEPRRVLITGGAGFIGSALVNYMVRKYPEITWVVLDRLDYCASLKNITVTDAPNYHFVRGDMGAIDFIMYVLQSHQIDTIMNLAAQSSVDHSENNSAAHVQDNIVAVHSMLEATRRYGGVRRFFQISTDESYGDQESGEPAHEASILMPNNVYAATKACSELLCRAYRVSYKIPLLISKGNNVYGPAQYPEKIFPRFAMQLLRGEKVTVHGKGITSRSFLHVQDTVRALETILFKGTTGDTYNIGTDRELTVLEVAEALRKRICPEKSLDEVVEYDLITTQGIKLAVRNFVHLAGRKVSSLSKA
jgi:dTDP-glucose 4,6-dehydratase